MFSKKTKRIYADIIFVSRNKLLWKCIVSCIYYYFDGGECFKLEKHTLKWWFCNLCKCLKTQIYEKIIIKLINMISTFSCWLLFSNIYSKEICFYFYFCCLAKKNKTSSIKKKKYLFIFFNFPILYVDFIFLLLHL